MRENIPRNKRLVHPSVLVLLQGSQLLLLVHSRMVGANEGEEGRNHLDRHLVQQSRVPGVKYTSLSRHTMAVSAIVTPPTLPTNHSNNGTKGREFDGDTLLEMLSAHNSLFQTAMKDDDKRPVAKVLNHVAQIRRRLDAKTLFFVYMESGCRDPLLDQVMNELAHVEAPPREAPGGKFPKLNSASQLYLAFLSAIFLFDRHYLDAVEIIHHFIVNLL